MFDFIGFIIKLIITSILATFIVLLTFGIIGNIIAFLIRLLF